MSTPKEPGRRAAEQAARLAYGQLIATLCQHGATLVEAEDALSIAFTRALDRWDVHGVPDAPEAWLLTTARRSLIDQARHAAVINSASEDVRSLLDGGVSTDIDSSVVPIIEQLEQSGEQLADRRLSLMMLCAHPEVPAKSRAPLMLQSVLGLTAENMSAAFLVSPSALGQRLARAKKLIRTRQLPFQLPPREELALRVTDVLEAIYAAFSTAYDTVESARDTRHGLAHEAIWLAQILVHELDESAEAHGLLSLMLLIQARVHARRDDNECYVPLSEQDRNRWNWRLIAMAEHHLGKAALLKQPGRFQIEAAIQSHHVLYEGAEPDWQALVGLYDELVVRAPTLAAWIGRAAALAQQIDAESGLEALALIPAERVRDYQPYWAVKAHLLDQAGQAESAQDAYTRAEGLCEDVAVRRFLARKRQSLTR